MARHRVAFLHWGIGACRRASAACGLAVVVLAAAGSTARGDHLRSYEYTAYRGDDPIGYYRVTVTPGRGAVLIETENDLEVGLGPVKLFTFHHSRRELWRGGELISLRGHTDKNGETYDISVTRQPDGYRRVINGEADTLDPSVKPFALWHDDLFTHRTFFSPMEDKIVEVDVDLVGKEVIDLRGEPVTTVHYRMEGDSERDVWYDPEGHVMKVRLRNYDPRIEYVLTGGEGPLREIQEAERRLGPRARTGGTGLHR